MPELQLQHPSFLWTLLLVVPLVLLCSWRSRALFGMGWIIALGVRLLWAILCVLALTGPSLVREKITDGTSRVIVLQDMSGSVGASANDSESIRQSIVGALPKATKVTTLAFAGNVWNVGDTPGDTGHTDIEGALNAANALSMEQNAAVILLSDGRATQGDSIAAAHRLAMRGAVVHTVPIGQHLAHGPQIIRIDPPTDVHVGIANGMRVTVNADDLVRANIRLLRRGGSVIDQRTIPLHGAQTLILHFTPDTQGLQIYTVDVQPVGPVSTSQPATSVVVRTDSKVVPVYADGPARILIADPFPEEVTALAQSLAPLKVPVDVITPDHWPEDLTPYAAIVASDWSGKELSPEQRGALRRYVEELGGGFVFIGGGNVLPARWKKNELAGLLPVILQDKPAQITKQRPPDISVCFVLDRSGSMGQSLGSATGGNTSKLELVKVAVQASIASLPEQSSVAVIAFDDTPNVIVPPTPLSQKEDVFKKVDGISLGGGTTMGPAIQKGLDLLAGMKGDKYLVVLTDGICEQPAANTSYWDSFTNQAKSIHVSWTSIAVGADADQKLLQVTCRSRCIGQFYYCDTGDKIPQVFLQHAQAIRRLTERKDRPIHARPGPAVDWLKDVVVSQMPALNGRILATAREQVDTVLLGETTDPLLASWHFGLGRVMAFTSDAKAGWGKDWIAWKGYAPFWLQVVQSVMRINPLLNVKVRSRISGNTAEFTFHVLNQSGQAVTDLKYFGQISAVPGSAKELPAAPPVQWKQLGAGEYQASMEIPASDGQYLVSVELKPELGASARYCAIVSGNESAEMARTGPDLLSLRAIAEAGQGICSDDPATIAGLCHQAEEQKESIRTEFSPWLIALCILLWPVDVAVRKLL